jgi:hypothetical protein
MATYKKPVNLIQKKFYEIDPWLCSGSTAVEHTTHRLKIEGSNPFPASEKEKGISRWQVLHDAD